MQQQMVEIEMASRNKSSGGYYSTSRPNVELEMASRNNTFQPEATPLSGNSETSGGETKRKNKAKNNAKNRAKNNAKNKINKKKSRKMQRNKQQAPIKKTAAQQERRDKLKSLHVKQQSLGAIHDGTTVLVEKEQDVDDAVGINTHKRKSFWKIDDEEHGVYFQDVETDETVWELPKDGDVVMEDDELQENPH